MDGLENTFQSRDANIRPGGSPTDMLMKVVDMTLVIGDNEISTPFKKGTEVGYIAFDKATIGDNGKLTISAVAAAEKLIYIIGKEMNLTVGGKTF